MTLDLHSPARSSTDRRALSAVAVTVLLWASAFVSIRSAGQEFSPGALALGRLVAGSVVLLAILLLRGRARRGPASRAPGSSGSADIPRRPK